MALVGLALVTIVTIMISIVIIIIIILQDGFQVSVGTNKCPVYRVFSDCCHCITVLCIIMTGHHPATVN